MADTNRTIELAGRERPVVSPAFLDATLATSKDNPVLARILLTSVRPGGLRS